MCTVTVYVPISLNQQFATQSLLLVRSLARAKFPGSWRVVFTVSRDTELTLDSSLLAWADAFPVSFRWVDLNIWEQFHYLGTALQQVLYVHDSEVLLFMDADTVVTGPLTELIEEVADSRVFAAWPAWQPPDNADFDQILTDFGLDEIQRTLAYSGYGLSFLSPKYCPPYFNAGFIAAHRDIIQRMGRTLPKDLADIRERSGSYYGMQMAICVNILRNHYPYRGLDMRYNASNGDFEVTPPCSGPEADLAVAAAHASLADTRVLHYCVQTQQFSRKQDMDGLERVAEFCAREGLNSGNRRLQAALTPLLLND